MVLYEIWNVGQKPFADLTNNKVTSQTLKPSIPGEKFLKQKAKGHKMWQNNNNKNKLGCTYQELNTRALAVLELLSLNL